MILDYRLMTVIITAVLTGIASSLMTIAALKVHIQYIREILTEHARRLSAIEFQIRANHEAQYEKKEKL